MIKVLVAEENVAEANKYCRYLSKCRDLKIKTVNSGDQALSTYLKTKPNIFILDSHFNDINSTEIIAGKYQRFPPAIPQGSWRSTSPVRFLPCFSTHPHG